MKHYISLLLVLVLFSCEKEPQQQTESPEYSVIIGNEGNFPDGISTLSLYEKSSGKIEHNAYQKANDAAIGSLVNSILVDGERLFFVVNGTGSLVVTDQDLNLVKIFKNLNNPRHIVKVAAGKYYLSSWGEDAVQIIDMSTQSISGSIPTGSGPERMIKYQNMVFVANGGGYGADSSLTVIDAQSDQVIGQVAVGHNPNSLQIDKQDQLWVLASGIPDYNDPSQSTPGSLMQFSLDSIEWGLQNSSDIKPAKSFVFDDQSLKPTRLKISSNGSELVFLDNGYSGNIQKMSINATELPSQNLVNGNFYGLALDPETDEIYASDPLSFTEKGKVYHFSLQNGSQLAEFDAGIIPGCFAFR